jgi:hypothetical protein
VEAVFTNAARYIAWPVHSLRALLDKKPDMRLALQQLASRDVSRKLEQLLAAP